MHLSADQTAILETVRDFCRTQIAPLSAQYDRSGEFPWTQLEALSQIGLLGACVPEEFGGSGLDSVTYALCLEEICKADASVGVLVSVTNGLPQQMLLRYGSQAQKEQWLTPLATGAKLGAFCLTSPAAARTPLA